MHPLALKPQVFLPVKAEPLASLLRASPASNHFDLGFRRQVVDADCVCWPLKVNLGSESPKINLNLVPEQFLLFVCLQEAWTSKLHK